ncbi:MAG: hypothetical protein II826_03585 [Prevotella sp.]|jgi:hypothetical protein|nr:hypothetical protein [Prevotella sp.]
MKKTNCNLSGIGAETFISLFAQSHEESHGNVTAKAIETLLGEQFGYQVVPALKFLLDNTTPAALVRFVYDFMSPRSVVAHSTASIVVRPIPWQMKRTGNIGRYVMYLHRQDGTEDLIRFTHQASTIFFLMHLIDRHQRSGELDALSLHRNEKPFKRLYRMVYDTVNDDIVASRYRSLLRRVVDHRLRAGRKSAIILDIRNHLGQLFSACGESYQPFAMTAHSHLSITPDHIVFEGEAECLLELYFR